MKHLLGAAPQILKAYDKDGSGIIDGSVEEYEVPSLLAPGFTYSATSAEMEALLA